MSHEVIKKIALLVFEKAKKELSNPTKNAICNHISDTLDANPEIEGRIDSKTIKRVYEKFIEGKEKGGPSEVTINYLTQYLGYENYLDFIEKSRNSIKDIHITKETAKTSKKRVFKTMALIISILFVVILITFSFFRRVPITSKQEKEIVVFLIDENNQTELGKLSKKNGYQFYTWLSTGKAELYYYSIEDNDGKEYPGAEMIEILPFWKEMNPIILSKL
ncbi:hypothetical protein [uncultured Aquimarina sp.]|uniref:hypothetical protein n=1 Tax=uncultured Aquimarina sp. TaxID=575652 RepID=UPI002637DD80|nr:hypothetical protein [uncultured Aquimarina sp.]